MQFTQDALFPESDVQTTGYAQPEAAEDQNVAPVDDDTVAEAA